MPRITHRNPSYRLHKASGQAVVTLNGKDFYLGEYGKAASRAEYDRLVAEWLAGGRRLKGGSNSDLCVVELASAYVDHAKSYYRKPDGTDSGEFKPIRLALGPLLRLYGRTFAADFGPLAFKAVRDEMVRLGWCRKYVNIQSCRIRRMFKWAVENELVPPSVHQALTSVAGLKAGRGNARESDPVAPVACDAVEAVLPHVPSPVRGLIRLQLLTGMRPGEACLMRGVDLDTAVSPWVYRPPSHKTKHHGHDRVIYLGPQAQEVVKPFLKPDVNAYLFCPADATREMRERRRAARKTPLSCGNRAGTHRKPRPKLAPGLRYTIRSYGQAIQRACDRAFPAPAHLARAKVEGKRGRPWETPAEWKARLGPALWKELGAWVAARRWHPHRLRHSAATTLRKRYGLEAAQVILGHKTLSVTEIYAEKNVEAARRIMGEVG